MSPVNLEAGSPTPNMPARKQPEDYRDLATARGLIWRDKVAPGTRNLTPWRCRAEGHVFERTYNLVQALKGCPICSGRLRKTPADYHALAEERGMRWLGPKVSTTNDLTEWQCVQGHRFTSRYTSLQQGFGCAICSNRVRKSARDYRALARAHRLTWLEKRPPLTRQKTLWRCAQGHRFTATYNTLQQGHGCPTCAGNRPPTAADFRRAGQLHDLVWLGPLVANRRAKSRWRCANGHVWETALNTVADGQGCPRCRPPRRDDSDYRALARRRGLTWLGPLPATVTEKTKWRCAQGHTFATRYDLIRRGSGCPQCAGHLRKTDADYRAMGRERKLTWLGPSVARTAQKTRWRCRRGHVFAAPYNTLRAGHGCPTCAGNARKTAADYRALARARKLRWIGPEVPRSVSLKSLWACSLGHRWATRYNSIQQGSGCPECQGRRPQPIPSGRRR